MPWRRFGHRIDREKIREKIRRGLKRPINDANTRNNQPKTRGRDGRGTRKDVRPAESAGGMKNVIVLETIEDGLLKNKIKWMPSINNFFSHPI
jgi:hypothetical protein